MFFLEKYNILLASKSPRRHDLLKGMGIRFSVPELIETEENYPENLQAGEITDFLAKLKANPYLNTLSANDILITSDTIVWQDNKVLLKPGNFNEAVKMLQKLSGNYHEVYTGICLSSKHKQEVFSVKTKVKFAQLTNEEIDYYVTKYKPYDKAGSYGIQEWIGYIGIESISGSYFNVMGLPTQALYKHLKSFV